VKKGAKGQPKEWNLERDQKKMRWASKAWQEIFCQLKSASAIGIGCQVVSDDDDDLGWRKGAIHCPEL
jgi:hypothetical protein